jgi:hypothetical protein
MSERVAAPATFNDLRIHVARSRHIIPVELSRSARALTPMGFPVGAEGRNASGRVSIPAGYGTSGQLALSRGLHPALGVRWGSRKSEAVPASLVVLSCYGQPEAGSLEEGQLTTPPAKGSPSRCGVLRRWRPLWRQHPLQPHLLTTARAGEPASRGPYRRRLSWWQ